MDSNAIIEAAIARKKELADKASTKKVTAKAKKATVKRPTKAQRKVVEQVFVITNGKELDAASEIVCTDSKKATLARAAAMAEAMNGPVTVRFL